MNDFATLKGMCTEGFQSPIDAPSMIGVGQSPGPAATFELLRLIQQPSNQVVSAPLNQQQEQQQASCDKSHESKSCSTSSSASCQSQLLQSESPTSVKTSSSPQWEEFLSPAAGVIHPEPMQLAGSQRMLSQESLSTEPAQRVKSGPPYRMFHSVEESAADNESLNLLFSDILDGCDLGFMERVQDLDIHAQVEPVSQELEKAFGCDDLKLVEECEASIFDGLDLQNLEWLPSLDMPSLDWPSKAPEKSPTTVFKVSNFDLVPNFPFSEPQAASTDSPSLSSDISDDASLPKAAEREEDNISDVKSSNVSASQRYRPVATDVVTRAHSNPKKRKADGEVENFPAVPCKRGEGVMGTKPGCTNFKAIAPLKPNFSTCKPQMCPDSIPYVHMPYPPRRTRKRSEITTSRAMASRMRRDKISNRLRTLYSLVPNGKSWDTASMLDETIAYVKYLRAQAAEDDC